MRAPTTPTARNIRRLLLLAASLGVGAVVWFVLGESEAVVAAESGGHRVLARVHGVAITEEEIVAAAAVDLRRLERQRQGILDEHLNDRVRALLIETAARERGVSVARFLADEVDARLSEIPQEQVAAFYGAHRDRFREPLEQVEKRIREHLAREALFERLAASGEVEIVDGEVERLLTGA